MTDKQKREKYYWGEHPENSDEELFCFEIRTRRGKTIVKKFSVAEIYVFLLESRQQEEKNKAKEGFAQK